MVGGITLIITILLVAGLSFGIMPGDCTLDAADCAIIEQAGANMRSMSGLTIDELTITMETGSADGDAGIDINFSGSGQMAWNDGQLDMDLQLGFATMASEQQVTIDSDGTQTVGPVTETLSEQQVHFVVKDGKAYTYDTSSDAWEQIPFMLDVRMLPTLDAPEAEWSGSDGVYTLTLTSASYLTSDPFIEMAATFFNALEMEEAPGELSLQLREIFGQMTTTEMPYTITYTIEDGFITEVQSQGTYALPGNEGVSTITFGMTLALSNHNGDITIETPDIELEEGP